MFKIQISSEPAFYTYYSREEVYVNNTFTGIYMLLNMIMLFITIILFIMVIIFNTQSGPYASAYLLMIIWVSYTKYCTNQI